ncbi:MAG: STAS domain-containing protein [Steroidobacteraceae bacterium]
MARRPRRAEAASQPAALAALGPGRFELRGGLGFDDAARMLAEGDAAFGALKQAEIDLAKVERVDSAGLALLLEWSIAARESGRALSYRNVPPAIAALAGISDVSELLAPAAAGGG